MISPLGQRQIFQTANMESLRQAHHVSEEIQRDITKMKAAEEHLVEDQSNVREIPEFERIRAEERKEGKGRKGFRRGKTEGVSEEGTKSDEDSAGDADPLLDFFA